eukprot:scpid83146/ scgid15269/ 
MHRLACPCTHYSYSSGSTFFVFLVVVRCSLVKVPARAIHWLWPATIQPMVDKLASSYSDVNQVWYGDDGAAGSGLAQVCSHWNDIAAVGTPYGYMTQMQGRQFLSLTRTCFSKLVIPS